MMSKRPQLFSLGLTASLLMTGCTVDAQLASQLLSSLQAAGKSGTAKASISASLAATGQSDDDSVIEIDDANQAVVKQALQVACGGPGMRIASVEADAETTETENEAEVTTEASAEPTAEPTAEATAEVTAEATAAPTAEPTVEATAEVQPVVVALADPVATPNQKEARSRRLKIDAQLEVELRQMGRMKGADRDRRFAEIQQRFPVMRNTVPVPVRAKSQNMRQVNNTQIIFVQMPQMGFQPGRAAYPNQASFRPGYASGGGYGTGGHGYQPQPRPAAPAVNANRVKVSGKAILDGLGNLPCQGYDAPVQATESAETDS